MTFYERLTALMKREKVSQAALEEKLGFSNGSISKWKKSMPTPERLKKLADYFGTTVDYLLYGEDKQPDEQRTPDIGADLNDTVAKLSSADTLMFNGMELDEETRKLLLASVESLMANANMMAKIKSENKPKEE